jgi:hypothetical protein
MSDDVPNLRGNAFTTVGFIVGPLLGAVMVVGGIVWQAAKYPDRSEFRAATNDLASVKQDVALMKYRQDGVEQRSAEIKATTDKILEELRTERRSRGR